MTGELGVKQANGCIEAKLSICSYREAIIISYWQNETSLKEFFHSPLHRQMMKNIVQKFTAKRFRRESLYSTKLTVLCVVECI